MSSIAAEAKFAEMLVSSDYRTALNAAYEQSETAYVEQRDRVQHIMVGALATGSSVGEQAWEMRRQAALAQIGGASLGPFNDYLFHSQGGESTPSGLTREDLDGGEPAVVRTNQRILSLGTIYNDPFGFFDNALGIIEGRKTESLKNIGPENYASALKIFADKVADPNTASVDLPDIKSLVDHCMEGFADVAQRDEPNFIEMTSVYFAISELPTGAFDEKFTQLIIDHSLKQLPDFDRLALSSLTSALGKLDLGDTGDTAAPLFDLALRKGEPFETTGEMRRGLRVLANLPGGQASNRAFETFLHVRNDLEQSLDIDGLDEVNQRLLLVARQVIDDPSLTLQAGELAQVCAKRAGQLFRRAEYRGEMTDTQRNELAFIVRRTLHNARSI